MIRLGISGCGAVTQLYYAPALRILGDEVRLVGAFDPDEQAAERFARPHRAQIAGSFEELLRLELDLVVVASPPRFHAEQTCAALNAGRAVLCEKPMAMSTQEAEQMVRTAASTARPLGIGMVRRLLPQAALIRSLLQAHALGTLRNIDIFEGGPFDWPIPSPSWFSADQGGGILQDIGVHVLDLLRWWLGEPSDVRCFDDALGGVSANCLLHLEFGDAQISARLSRDWYRPNGYRITGDAGWIHWPIHERDELEGELHGRRVGITPSGPCSYPDAIAAQIRAVAQSEPVVDGAEGLKTLDLLQRCREGRNRMSMEWL
jgi:predicted dehydrogenase